MREIGAFEAKTHLSQLLDRVERGEEFTITRRGKPVARLVATEPRKPRSEEEVARIMQSFLELQRNNRLDGLSIRDLINEGRKW
jgi:prevent-host-death family protein